MTGDKPDPRLRTPMQWSAQSGVGFTTGKEWESPQPDSLTTNVATEESDSHSLLNLYRRLIHLRRRNDALANGVLVPLTASDAHVAAYLRATPHHAVLVIANLGNAPAASVVINSAHYALAPGRYVARNLLGGANGATLLVDPQGQIRGYVPLAGPLGARTALVLDLTPAR